MVVFFTESYFKKNWFLKIPKLAPRVERSSFCFFRFFDSAQNDKKQKSEWRKQVKTQLKTENGLLLISKIPHIQFQRKEIRKIIAAANSCIGDGVI